jgi:hypothetical protein
VVSRGFGDDVLSLFCVPLDGGEEKRFAELTIADSAYDAVFMEQYDCLYVATYEGDFLRVDDQNRSTTLLSRDEGLYCSVDDLGDGLLVCDNRSGTYSKLELTPSGEIANTQVMQQDFLLSSPVATGPYVTSTLDSGSVLIFNAQSNEIRELTNLKLQNAFRLRTIGVMACAAYLAVAALALLVSAAARAVRSGRGEKVGRILAIGMFVALLVVLVSYFSREGYDEAVATRTSEVLTHANYLYMTPNAVLSNAANRVAERIQGTREADEDADYYLVCGDLDALVLSAEDNGIGLYYNLYATDGAGDVRYVSSNRRDGIYGARVTDPDTASLVDEAARGAGEYDGDVVSGIGARRGGDQTSTSIYAMVPLYTDGGECRAVLELGSRMESFEFKQSRNAFERILAFCVLAASIYIGMSEFSRQGEAMLRYRKQRAAGVEGAGALLARTFTLVVRTASRADLALSAIVAKDILEASGGGESMLLIGLPPLAHSLGILIGRFVFSIMGPRRTGRSLLFPSVGVTVVALLACFASATQGAFWPFVLGKLVASVGFGVLLGSEATHSDVASNDTDRAIAKQYHFANTAANVFSGLLGGIVSAIWGTPVVYVASAALALSSGMMLWHMLPKGRICLDHTEKTDARELVRVVLSPQMLPLFLCGGIPQALADGFGSLIFPLFMNSSGISDASISTLSSIGNVVTGLFDSPIKKARNVGDRRLRVFASLLCLAITFAPFAFNQTVVWAVTSIVIMSVLLKILDDWFWYQYASLPQFGFKKPQGRPLLDIERNICSTFQPIVLGALMTTGTLNTCLLLAVYFFVDAMVFGAIVRRQNQKK